jgi:hypothetical protein
MAKKPDRTQNRGKYLIGAKLRYDEANGTGSLSPQNPFQGSSGGERCGDRPGGIFKGNRGPYRQARSL